MKLILALSTLVMAGCATMHGSDFDAVLSTWVGADRDQLFETWGPPNLRAELTDGGEVIEYQWQGRWREQENPGEKGLAYAFGRRLGERLAGGAEPPGCKARFQISSNGTISEYQFAGADCRTSADARAGMVRPES